MDDCVEEINEFITQSDKHSENKEMCSKLLIVIHELEGNFDTKVALDHESIESGCFVEENGEIISCTQKTRVETGHEICPGAGIRSLKQYLMKKRDFEAYSYQRIELMLESKKKQKSDVAAKLKNGLLFKSFVMQHLS